MTSLCRSQRQSLLVCTEYSRRHDQTPKVCRGISQKAWVQMLVQESPTCQNYERLALHKPFSHCTTTANNKNISWPQTCRPFLIMNRSFTCVYLSEIFHGHRIVPWNAGRIVIAATSSWEMLGEPTKLFEALNRLFFNQCFLNRAWDRELQIPICTPWPCWTSVARKEDEIMLPQDDLPQNNGANREKPV